MPPADTHTLESRIAAAKKREASARAEAARLRRELSRTSRRLEAQRLCVLGRAWERRASEDYEFRILGQRYLDAYVSRDTDRAALRGSPFAVPEPSPVEVDDDMEAHHGRD